jgi:hypothetical protein
MVSIDDWLREVGMMVRFVSCGVRECRQAVIDRERDRDITNQEKKEGHRTVREQNTYSSRYA